MRILIVFLVLFCCTQTFATCPNLRGEFHCMISSSQYSLLIIKQESRGEVDQFSFDYTSIPGEPDIILAGADPIPDGWGYLNRCSGKRLLSMAGDGSSLSEMYINQEDHFVLTYNDHILYQCPRKKN